MKVIPRKFAGWTTPAYNGRTRLMLPTGPTYHELIFRSNLLNSQILWVNVVLGTETIVRCKGTDLQMLERYRKIYETQPGAGDGVATQGSLGVVPTGSPNYSNQAVNEMVLNFSDISNLGVESRYFTSLVTSPGEQLYVELELGAGIGTTPPAIVLETDGEVSANDPKGRRWLPKLVRTAYNATQVRDNVFTGLIKGHNRYYRRVHFETGGMDNVRIVKDEVRVYDRNMYRNVAHLKRNNRAPQPNYYHLDFIASDFGRMDMFHADAVEDINVIFDMAAVANIEMLVEQVDDLHPEWEAGQKQAA